MTITFLKKCLQRIYKNATAVKSCWMSFLKSQSKVITILLFSMALGEIVVKYSTATSIFTREGKDVLMLKQSVMTK